MTTIRRAGGAGSTATQRDNGTAYSYASLASASMAASTTAPTNAGLLFPSISISQGDYIRKARLVIYLNTSGSNATGAKYELSAHKTSSPPAFKTSSGAGVNDLISRFSSKTDEKINVLSSVPYTSEERRQVFDVTSIVQEIVNQGGWSEGSNLVFLLDVANDVNYNTQFYGGSSTRQDYWPELYIEYGTPASDSFDFSLAIIGDSHAVCAAHAGEPRYDIPVAAPGWDTIIEETYAGMVSDNALVGGDIFGGGDQIRGYSPGGLLQDNFEDKYGDKVIVYRGEFAKGGLTLETWWFNKFVEQASPGDPHYDPDHSFGPGYGRWNSVDSFLANPPSSSKRMFLWFSLLGNDLIQIGSQYTGENRLIVPKGSMFDDKHPVLVEKTVDIIRHVFSVWEDNDVEGWVLFPGYQNFTVMAPEPVSSSGRWKYPPNGGSGSDQPFERMVWCTSSFGVGYANADFDGTASTLRGSGLLDPTDPDDPWILNQSSYMKASIWKQIDDYGSFSVSAAGGSQWAAAQAWAGTIPGSGDHTWFRTYGAPVSRSIDLWKDTMRNVTDISVNEIVVGQTNSIIAEAIDILILERPDWAHRLLFHPNQGVHGPDLENSADPESEFAQPPRASTVRTDGIHPTSERFNVWVRAYIDWLDSMVPFLPGYSNVSKTDFFPIL